ncbi:GNAT family N-acetyltransferase [Pontibacillus sp. HMF3514]|uniref:GNAT family N-acetyltransferase n=1 Tax=Pontibacillus sp. HMF3514 TaxID=2692425 RepID=UPI00131FC023|nr:GNAT family N-acetyltransferase [Pontibacillus sp. HMF3514]QHE52271.1 GNAT family N-acetyltransferase [Pontibacillus sp. HMF3514]
MLISIFRRAIPEESPHLSNIAIKSKAYWGYSEAFMKECELLLHVPSDRIAKDHVYVIEDGGSVTGFYSIIQNKNHAWLEDFYLDPVYIGEGLGKRMWYHMVSVARNYSIEKIEWESDPYAAPFYEWMGATKIGDTATGANQKPLPKYQYIVLD